MHIYCLAIKRGNGQFWINNGGFLPGFSMEVHGGFSRRATSAKINSSALVRWSPANPLVKQTSPVLQELFLETKPKKKVHWTWVYQDYQLFTTHCFSEIIFLSSFFQTDAVKLLVSDLLSGLFEACVRHIHSHAERSGALFLRSTERVRSGVHGHLMIKWGFFSNSFMGLHSETFFFRENDSNSLAFRGSATDIYIYTYIYI